MVAGGVGWKELVGLRGEAQGGIEMEEGTEVFVLDLRHERGVIEHVVVSRRVATKE